MKRMRHTVMWLLLVGSYFLLAACGGDDITPGEGNGKEYLKLEVIVGEYDGSLQQGRAGEVGNSTEFSKNDRIGVTVIDSDGTMLSDNVPYKYNGSEWMFDGDYAGGKNPCYYSPGATCLVYYPYRSAADGVKDEAGLKKIIVPLSDQRDWEQYLASNLMHGTGTLNSKTLTVTLQHAYPSLVFSLTGSCTVVDGGNQRYVLPAYRFLGVNVMIGEVVYCAHRLADNRFLCIIPEKGGEEDEIRYFGIIGKAGCGSTITAPAKGWVGNTRYSVVQELDVGEYSPAHVTTGDFCCRTDGGKVYFIPGEAESLNDAQKKACQGIVFYMRDEASPEDTGGYEEFSGDPRGYILSFDENTSQWANGYVDGFRYVEAIIDGYYWTYRYDFNTQLVNKGQSPALKWCIDKTRIENSDRNVVCSKWYMISLKEMEILSKEVDLININLSKVGGTILQDVYYFTVNRLSEGTFDKFVATINSMNGKVEKFSVTDEMPYRAACAFQ